MTSVNKTHKLIKEELAAKIKRIEEKLIKRGYFPLGIALKRKDANGYSEVNFTWVESNTERCCGLREIGSFTIIGGMTGDGKGAFQDIMNIQEGVLKESLNLFIQWRFLQNKLQTLSVNNIHDTSDTPYAIGRFFATNGVSSCKLIEDALGHIKGQFSINSTFRNASHGTNRITIWSYKY